MSNTPADAFARRHIGLLISMQKVQVSGSVTPRSGTSQIPCVRLGPTGTKRAPVGGTRDYRSIPSESVKASSMSTPR